MAHTTHCPHTSPATHLDGLLLLHCHHRTGAPLPVQTRHLPCTHTIVVWLLGGPSLSPPATPRTLPIPVLPGLIMNHNCISCVMGHLLLVHLLTPFWMAVWGKILFS